MANLKTAVCFVVSYSILLNTLVLPLTAKTNPTPLALDPVAPVTECVVDNGGSNGFTAWFGYNNPNSQPVSIPLSPSRNKFTPAPQDRGQTTSFLPGRNRYVFSLPRQNGNLIWHLDGQTATASLNQSPRCAAVALDILSPQNNSTTLNSSITVSGKAYSLLPNAGGIASVTVNNTPAVYNAADKSWSRGNVALQDGANVITVRAADSQGNQATASITISKVGSVSRLDSVDPTRTTQGQTLQVTLRGRGTHWAAGQTSASLGEEVSVGGANFGELGQVTVINETTAVADVTVATKAALAPRRARVVTNLSGGGTEEVKLENAFIVLPLAPPGAFANKVTTIAGSAGSAGFADGAGAAAKFSSPSSLAVGADDAVYIADADNNRIRVAREQSGGAWSVSTVAGSGVAGYADGAAIQAKFNSPQGIAVAPDNTILVADTSNNRIRKILPDGTVSTVAGNANAGFSDGQGTQAAFNNPKGLAVDNGGNIYVADTGNSAVRRIDANGNVTTIAGNGTAGSTDSPDARFNGLAGITIDGDNVYVYIADGQNHRIRRLDSTGTVMTLTGVERGFADGYASEARFAEPTGLAIDAAGRLIITDTINSLIRSVAPDLAVGNSPLAVTTIAGAGERGSNNGTGDVARFNLPRGVAVSRSGAVFVADSGNQILRRIGFPPQIISFSPQAGRVGDSVTIYGEHFDGRGTDKNTVALSKTGGGKISASVTTATGTQLTFVVPNGAATGRITITTADGTATSATDFTVQENPSPVITDFLPKRGKTGDAVRLLGTDLKNGSATPLVTFRGANNTRLNALVTSSAAAEVNVLVPNGAVTGSINLTTAWGSASTAQEFVVEDKQDFSVTVSPSTIQAVDKTEGTAVVTLVSNSSTFTQLAKLSINGMPNGVTAKFDPENITAGATSTLKLNLQNSTAAVGSYPLTIKAAATVDGHEVIKQTTGSLNILAAGQTTISGRVLNTDSEPVIGATVSLDGRTATTDASGSFILSGVTAGQARPLQIDGRTASAPNRTYPVITEPANIIAGRANQVPYIFYLPPIDIGSEVEVVPGQTTVAGNHKVEGLQMTIPPNANLRNRDGSPVTRVSITPLAIDRTPTPLPPNVKTALVYTSQPGGALTDVPIPVVYPNLLGVDPNTRVELYAFNHDTVQWYVYGYGRVSADGKTIAPETNPNTGRPYGLRDFSWHFPNAGAGGNPNGNDSCPTPTTPNPVDLSSGIKLETATDVSFGGSRGGITLTRNYSSDNSAQAIIGRFGRGWKDNYEITLNGSWTIGGSGRVVRPDEQNGRIFSYKRTDADGSLLFTSNATVSQLADTIRKLSNGTLEYRYGSGGVLKFDSTGKMTAITDRNGNTTTLTYTGNNLSMITDAVGRTLTFQYDGSGKVTKITDPLNRSWNYAYNNAVAYGILETVTDPLGNVMRYDYSIPAGIRLSAITDPNGNQVKQISYDSAGRVISQRFADGGIETYEYQLSGGIVTQTIITDPLGRKMTKRFNANGYVVEQKDALGQISKIDRNLTNNLSNATIGSCGCAEESRKFDERGNKTEVTDRQGNTTKFEYEPVFNNVTKATDKLNRQTQFSYDVNGNLTSITDAIGRTSSLGYDQYGRLTSSTDALGQTETYEYDANGFMNARVDKLGKRWQMNYDQIGRLQSQVDALGRTVSYSYDNLDRLTALAVPSGAMTTFGYDANGNRVSVKDALNRVWRTTFDAKNRPVKMTDPLGRIRKSEYDLRDQMIKAVSPSGRQMRYEYDERGQVAKMFDGLNNAIEFTYDYEKKLVGLKNESGYLTTFEYDTLDRPIKQINPLGQTSAVEYDALGNLTKATDQLGRITTFTYNTVNRVEQVNYADAQVNYSYDNLNRPTQITDTQGGTINWSYNALGQVLSETTANGFISYSYNDARQRRSMSVQGRAAVNYSYDTAGRLQTISQGAESFNYSYDALSRMESLTRPNGVTSVYEYDEVYRLKRLKHFSDSQTIEDLHYGYNADDDIASISSLNSQTLLPSPKTVSSADAANRITQSGGTNYSFDAKGQTTTRTDSNGTTVYNWDARGRMTGASLPNGQSINYSYDALGRRQSRTSNNQTTQFIYDGQDVVEDKQGTTIQAEYVNGLGIDNKLKISNSNGSLYFLKDHLGSTQGLTGINGNVAEWQRYEAFGNSNLQNSLTRYGYTGRERDEETNLNYYRARWYDADQGRFISQDPIGFAGGDTNIYRYVKNNVINSVDPSGLDGPAGSVPKIPMGGGEPPRRAPCTITDLKNCGTPTPTPSTTPTPQPPRRDCPPEDSGYHPFLPQGMIGLTGGAAGFFGLLNGAAANVNGVVGLANDGTNIKAGTAGSVGGWADTPSGDRWAFGGAAGAGGGFFASNATSFDQLNGGFDSYQVSGGPFAVEYAYSGDIWTISVNVGKSVGAGATHYQTYTPDWTTHEVVIR